MSIGYIQNNEANARTVATTGSVSASNTLIVALQAQYWGSSSPGTITDSAGGTWTNVANYMPTSAYQFLYFICNNPAAAVHSVTWNPAVAPTYGTQMNISEWSDGPLVFVNGAAQAVASGSPQHTPSITPTATGHLLLAIGDDSSGTSNWTVVSPFTAMAPGVGTNVFALYVDSAATAISCGWTLSASNTGGTAIGEFAIAPTVVLPGRSQSPMNQAAQRAANWFKRESGLYLPERGLVVPRVA